MAHGDDNRKGNEPPDEAAILADIRYFEERLAVLSDASSERERASAQVYRLLIRQRRQLLAAIRDGAPERWPEYAGRSADNS